MLTPRENYEKLLATGHGDRLVNQYEPFAMAMFPYRMADKGVRGTEFKDTWGVTTIWREDEPGSIPITDDEHKVCPDITEWKKYVKAPALKLPESAWDQYIEEAARVDRKEHFLTCSINTGLFERMHSLMGFEDALVNMLIEEDDFSDLLDYITDWRIEYLREIIDHMHPDYILSHDDWGSMDKMLMSPDTWREMFKPRYEQVYGYIRSRGVHIIHHADSYLMPIVPDMVDLGIEAWQGVLPSNDINTLQKQLDGKMILMGGINCTKIDVEDWNKNAIDEEVDRVCREYAAGGGFIPCMTYGGPGSIYQGVYDTISDAINRINAGS